METYSIKTYTVKQIRNWLQHNSDIDGLSSEVIKPSFAWALIHNPYLRDDDPIVAALYECGCLAAATCAFPDLFDLPLFVDDNGIQRRIWWFPMLWCKPEYRRKHYGTLVLSSLAEQYGWECSWAAWAVPASRKIFENNGHKTYFFLRYFLENKSINTKALKGKVALIYQTLKTCCCSTVKPKIPQYGYTLCYLNNVDDFSFDFINNHREKHFFHSSIEKLNWDLQYPWSLSAILDYKVLKTGDYFSDVFSKVYNSFVQVWYFNKLIGVYRISQIDSSLSCDNIFYENQFCEIVFASVVEHIKKLGITSFDTEDGKLYDYVNKYIYFPKSRVEKLSLTIPQSIHVPYKIIR